MSTYSVSPDAIIQRRHNKWFFSNPRTRSHVILSNRAAAVVFELAQGSEEEWIRGLENSSGYDATEEFFGEYGLHADHSGFKRAESSPVSAKDLFYLLCKRWLVVDNTSECYRQYLAPLGSVLDREHLGTFHQRVGQYLTVKKRLRDNRWRWWHDQKFAQDGLSLREDGPYKNVQDNFISTYFSQNSIREQRVLDFACGNGYYSSKLADLGAIVTGIDTSSELIALAERNFSGKAKFVCPVSIEAELEWFSRHSAEFDVLFMQDIMLLMLNPENGEPPTHTKALLQSFFEVLKPGGSLYMMEPNPIFWLAGRYGDQLNPYAIVTEYQQQLFNVMPILPVVLEAMFEVGFALTEYTHPNYCTDKPDVSFEKGYANEFAIWDFLRFRTIKK